ncbi:uncharacterized protein CLUP02_01211 [Colletotrichum lupini]|uniref:Uncharacterized protein n=1 Tax=Colletotrichum lupini TaxID=145971 RepID=A0A9Q8SCM3_9PEZI|nr:uncharacterized protein CLUP02_01211 [Colletotrichum lupini]UQC74560.1 hypothetical protein CLUP02_01211 [Colletotrichum lupini]
MRDEKLKRQHHPTSTEPEGREPPDYLPKGLEQCRFSLSSSDHNLVLIYELPQSLRLNVRRTTPKRRKPHRARAPFLSTKWNEKGKCLLAIQFHSKSENICLLGEQNLKGKSHCTGRQTSCTGNPEGQSILDISTLASSNPELFWKVVDSKLQAPRRVHKLAPDAATALMHNALT